LVKSELRLENNACNVKMGKGEKMRSKHVRDETHILANAEGDESRHQRLQGRRDIRSGDRRETNKSGYKTKSKRTRGAHYLEGVGGTS
jgi:hypothetical protein